MLTGCFKQDIRHSYSQIGILIAVHDDFPTPKDSGAVKTSKKCAREIRDQHTYVDIIIFCLEGQADER